MKITVDDGDGIVDVTVTLDATIGASTARVRHALDRACARAVAAYDADRMPPRGAVSPDGGYR